MQTRAKTCITAVLAVAAVAAVVTALDLSSDPCRPAGSCIDLRGMVSGVAIRVAVSYAIVTAAAFRWLPRIKMHYLLGPGILIAFASSSGPPAAASAWSLKPTRLDSVRRAAKMPQMGQLASFAFMSGFTPFAAGAKLPPATVATGTDHDATVSYFKASSPISPPIPRFTAK